MLKMSEWIDVKDKLPELGRAEFRWIPRKWVLVWDGTNRFLRLIVAPITWVLFGKAKL